MRDDREGVELHLCYLCGRQHEVAEDAVEILCPACRAWAAARGIVPGVQQGKEQEDEDRDEA
jgi:predicted RNA-binding Zn-ribbon protein involved in translation (DUF1610 family)